MKGLLVKDIQLVLKQKTTLIIWLVLALFFLVMNQDAVLGVSYNMFLSAVLLVGTVSYDDFDNGMGFLMTLPVSRKVYALEKYVLVIAGVFGAGALVSMLGIIYILFFQNGVGLDEFIVAAPIMFCVSILFASIMLPVQLKFGAEKSRIFMLILMGAIFLVILLISRTQINIQYPMIVLSQIQPVDVLIGLVCLVIPIVLISMIISVKIVKKEEY